MLRHVYSFSNSEYDHSHEQMSTTLHAMLQFQRKVAYDSITNGKQRTRNKCNRTVMKVADHCLLHRSFFARLKDADLFLFSRPTT